MNSRLFEIDGVWLSFTGATLGVKLDPSRREGHLTIRTACVFGSTTGTMMIRSRGWLTQRGPDCLRMIIGLFRSGHQDGFGAIEETDLLVGRGSVGGWVMDLFKIGGRESWCKVDRGTEIVWRAHDLWLVQSIGNVRVWVSVFVCFEEAARSVFEKSVWQGQ